MARRIQSGIYYDDEYPYPKGRLRAPRNRTFGLVSLRAKQNCNSHQIWECLEKLWHMYVLLKKGRIRDLGKDCIPSGSLEVLIGYGENIFRVRGVRKRTPRDLKDKQFSVSSNGGDPILSGSGLRFSADIHTNLSHTDHIVVQFISNTQLAAYRAIVETFNFLSEENGHPLTFSKFFTGFQRDDGRSWLGFHDGISNMRSPKERKGVISIDKTWNHLTYDDIWTEHGTYLAFLRIVIDLQIWQNLGKNQQDLIVGRDKITGKPIIGVDEAGNAITDDRCPEIARVTRYISGFQDHPDYFVRPRFRGSAKQMIDVDASARILNQSHIGRTRHIDGIDSKDPSSNRIYRQSFEFIERGSDPIKPIKLGLNFVSFQNDPKRLFSLIASPHWLGTSSFGGSMENQNLSRLVSVDAAGIFFVPSIEKPFPGASIFI